MTDAEIHASKADELIELLRFNLGRRLIMPRSLRRRNYRYEQAEFDHTHIGRRFLLMETSKNWLFNLSLLFAQYLSSPTKQMPVLGRQAIYLAHTTAWSSKGAWNVCHTPGVRFALPNCFFDSNDLTRLERGYNI